MTLVDNTVDSTSATSTLKPYYIFEDGDFTFDSNRRKVCVTILINTTMVSLWQTPNNPLMCADEGGVTYQVLMDQYHYHDHYRGIVPQLAVVVVCKLI